MLVALAFLAYDLMVLKRNEMMISTAAKSNSLVNSFVPDHLKARLEARQQDEEAMKGRGRGMLRRSNSLKAFLNDGPKPSIATDADDSDHSGQLVTAPLADLFLNTTVLFADIR